MARRENVLNDIAAELSKKHSIKTQVVASDLGLLEGCEKVFTATIGLNVGLFIAAAGFGTSGP
ncbi:hypothetical protein EBZ80_09570 [bacterium]|nr:hypothetical protein [bacterium]